jgi:tyrosinase
MHFSSTSILLTVCGHVAALVPQAASLPPRVLGVKATELPLDAFNTPKFAVPLTLMDAVMGVNASVTTIHGDLKQLKKVMPDLQLPATPQSSPETRDLHEGLERFEKRQSTCLNPRVRIEWDSYSDSDRQALVDSIKCLMRGKPSGQFNGSQNRYEDLVVLHQSVTPAVHGNAKFLLFHRYYLWTFEDMLRRECNFNRAFPWFNEPKYSGHFLQSSIFSARWLGAMNVSGNCVSNGQFAYLASNIGPGPSNTRHCLSRNGDESKTANTRASITDACNARPSYADMASCAEGAAHAWGHNGIGAVMQDTYAAPADPIFWLHHAYVDRNFRLWQNGDSKKRTTSVGGTDANGKQITLDYVISMSGVRPDVKVRDLLDTQGPLLCYKYSF